MNDRETMIQNYLDGYNQMDIDRMVADFDPNILFENMQNGEVNLSLIGIAAFRQQAEQALTYFSSRRQTVKSFVHFEDRSEVDIDYRAILAMDFPNGLEKGQALQLSGKSVFTFQDGKIIRLTDIS